MNKTKNLLILPALLTLSFASASISQANANAETQAEVNIEKEYKINTLFQLPQLVRDGVNYSCTIEFPNGETYYQTEVVLSEVGVYKLHYSAEKDGNYYAEEYSFLVRNPYIGFSGTKSFSSFERSARTYDKEGLYVSLAEGETLTFNEPIDLSSDNQLINLFVAPSVVGSIDFSELYVTLTEVADPSNSLTARAKASIEGQNAPWTYWSAKGKDQRLTGYEASFDNIHIGNDFGSPVTHSFYGQYSSYFPNMKVGDATLSLRYNKDENAIYQNSSLIIDFDNPKFFSNLWDGFKTNLVTMSIYAKGYSSSSANFVILSAKDKDLKKETIIDEKGPEIEVDCPYETLPNAKVGYSYPIFNATAKDENDGECKVSTKVYFNYGSGRECIVPTNNDSFEVSKEGIYAIIYEASDKMGNVSKKVLTVKTSEDVNEIKIDESLDIVKEAKQGERYDFPNIETTGGSGKITSHFEVYYNNDKYPSDQSSFIPKDKGTYEIKYIAKDIIGQSKTYSYELETKQNLTPVIYEDIAMPRYYISEAIYTLPEAICYDYSSGVGVAITMDVTIDNGLFSYECKSGDDFVPKIEGSQEKMFFTFHYKDLEIRKEVLTVNPYTMVNGINRFTIENFLISENLYFNIGDRDIDLFVKQKGDAKLEFANSVIAQNSSIQLISNPGKDNFSNVKVTFTDSLNEEEKVTLTLKNNKDGSIAFNINDRSYLTSSSFSKNNNLTMGYADNRFYLNTTIVECESYDNGKAFNGFSSDRIYFSVSIENAKAGAGLKLSKIDNQSISYASSDYSEPRIIIHGDYGGTYAHNEVAVINKVESSDVLDPNSTCYVTVKDPNGKTAIDIDGVILDGVIANKEYKLKLSDYGQYIVTYTAADSSDNKANFIYAITVEDNTAPTIKITGEVPSSVKVGENVRIPSFEVSDDQDENVTTTVFIETSHGEIIYLGKHNAFKPKQEGTYTIKIRAMDEAGNIAYATVTFAVTK